MKPGIAEAGVRMSLRVLAVFFALTRREVPRPESEQADDAL
jgi:hypothetical protein